MLTELKERLYSIITTNDHKARCTALYTTFCTNTIRARTSKRLSPATFTQLEQHRFQSNTITLKRAGAHSGDARSTISKRVPILKDPLRY